MDLSGFTAQQYAGQLVALLPFGPAWPRSTPGAALVGLMNGWADEFGRLDARAHQLLDETDPRTAYELLSEWENVLGLPDPCTAMATSIGARQAACWRKLAYQAGQTPAFYIALAASVGFAIEIHEFDPDVDDFDGSLTALIAGGEYRYVWRVHVLNAGDFTYFLAGDPVGGLLRDGDAAVDLECILTHAKPAHTLVIFSYPEAVTPPTVEYVSGVTAGFETATAIDLSTHIGGGTHTAIEAGDGDHGTTGIAGDVVTYTPVSGYIGGDVFSYRAIGPGGTTDWATVTLTVSSVAAPTVTDYSGVHVAHDTATAIDLSAHVSGSHTSVSALPPAHGAVSVAGDVVTYTPVSGYAGADSFTFTATGAGGTAAPATVSLTVDAVAAPVTSDAAFGAHTGVPTALDLAAHITGPHTSIAAGAPGHGSVSVMGDVVTYTSAGAFIGSDSFTFTATGPGGTSAPSTVSLTVTSGGGGGEYSEPI
jgi:uncharacterized protein YmfQ (DUF2313 family)